MKISGFEKLTLLNYPGVVSCIIFTKGCNFRCPYCQNSSLIDFKGESDISDEEVLDYLIKRKGILDGICISGGEPLLQKDIKFFVRRVKELGYKIKIDTNGSSPLILKELIDEHLIDYVAMDIKNTFPKYKQTVGCKLNIENIKKSIEILENSYIDYEFRTTIVKEFHELDDILQICKMLNNKSKYYIQNFQNSDGVLNKKLHGFSENELKEMYEKLNKKYKNVKFRDI